MAEVDLSKIWRIFSDRRTNESSCQGGKWFDVISGFNPYYARMVDRTAFEDLIETTLFHNLSDCDKICSEHEAEAIFSEILTFGIYEEGEHVITPGDYKTMMGCIAPISCALYQFAPEYFFPYFYQYKFDILEYTFDVLGLELPAIPKRTDLIGRCLYYWEICKLLGVIREKFSLSPQELPVFLYEFIPLFEKPKEENMPEPSQCWMIGGRVDPRDLDASVTLWQTNIDTRRGDILLHYETTPISAITGLWIAEEDAIVDPLTHWYSNTYIGHRVALPRISKKEMSEHDSLSKFPLVRKNFQGVNGFPVDSDTYKDILALLEAKGFDTASLPHLYAPTMPDGIVIDSEKDVEERLLQPLLSSFGLKDGVDYIRQLGIHVGSGHRVFPDFAVYYNKREETTRVIIEAKLHMKTRADVEAAFFQARSYALNLQSRVIVLCDKIRILVYLNRNGAFNMINPIQFGWNDMNFPEKYNALKNIINQ